ncbi:MAG: hypothetical protein O9333_14730 [Beijerinckiaceae bacterium]|jgi:hypothetical protein|nr:hypothetical protein [Beijerinckiaceae bacterium]
MFRQLIGRTDVIAEQNANADLLFRSGPAQILTLMNQAWTRREGLRSGVFKKDWEDAPMPVMSKPADYLKKFTPTIDADVTQLAYPHAIEAFCLENTRIVEIFRRVVGHFAYGEQLAVPPDRSGGTVTTDIVPWLRTTETLFFNPLPLLTPYAVTSELRNDPELVRRNLYYRLFGADLLHPAASNGNVEQMKPAASNREFFPTFERLLAEVWRGIVNAKNTSGRRDTDDAAIATMTTRLHDIMADRRLGANLQREEFYTTAMLSWLHTAILSNSPIVTALKADADNPADRLARIGDRVGLKPHVHSAAYIQMGPLAGFVLDCIATGKLNEPENAFLYYSPTSTSPFKTLAETMTQLITLYMRATGRDIKAAAVTVTQRA